MTFPAARSADTKTADASQACCRVLELQRFNLASYCNSVAHGKLAGISVSRLLAALSMQPLSVGSFERLSASQPST